MTSNAYMQHLSFSPTHAFSQPSCLLSGWMDKETGESPERASGLNEWIGIGVRMNMFVSSSPGVRHTQQ